MAEILVVAAEASADRYAGSVLRELNNLSGKISAWGIGGDHCLREGLEIVEHANRTAVMGIVEVLSHYRLIRSAYRRILERCKKRKVDAALLIDYPGFNFSLMKALKKLEIPVIYYICPQVWAWKKNRVYALHDFTDRRVVIFPFEVDFFKNYNIDVEYHGHPLLEEIPPFPPLSGEEHTIALLPGSRKQEVRRHLPICLKTIDHLKENDFNVRVFPSPTLDREVYSPFLKGYNRKVEFSNRFEGCSAALVASGTATLEAALHGVPSLVLYRMNPLSYHLLRPFVRVPHVSIVNLLMNRRVFPEFLQKQARPDLLAKTLNSLLRDPAIRSSMREELKKVREVLGFGNVSRAVAGIVAEYIS